MGVVMSHLLSRVYTVLKEERPYQLRDPEGKRVTMVEARSLIRERFRVPEEVRRLRRHHNRPKKKENVPAGVPFPSLEWADHGTRGGHCSKTRPSRLHPKRAYQAISSGAMKSFYPLTYFRISCLKQKLDAHLASQLSERQRYSFDTCFIIPQGHLGFHSSALVSNAWERSSRLVQQVSTVVRWNP
jgi:hypothetical protein